MKTVSIIIPHHNSSTLLKRLIKSIPLSLDAEIIVVDDNSNLTEFNTIKNYSQLYNFRLYKNEGKTAGGARNTGLKYANGKWIIFADADDIFTDTLEKSIVPYFKSDYDIIFFNVNSIISESGEKAYRDRHIKYILSKYQSTKNENYLRCMYLVPWGKMYKKDFITYNSIKYEERSAGNDMWFAVRSGVEANKIYIDYNEIYTCTVSKGSITTTLSKDRFEDKFQATIRTNSYLREKNLSNYQVSVLYFIAKAKQFGWKYFSHIILECIRNKSNLFIGLGKIFQYKKVLQDRQNPSYLKKL